MLDFLVSTASGGAERMQWAIRGFGRRLCPEWNGDFHVIDISDGKLKPSDVFSVVPGLAKSLRTALVVDILYSRGSRMISRGLVFK